ncbi:unnamed protein product [Protopolystoma xenopodis]|uniref:DOP1-like TPR domain-containing protein n=1 Tax=Protopolystoma xenopodis TaxID=117903 RepID=A0A448XL77_9PLAT|nr:unnamed protein product [Protopolystoma xenopodis]
MLHTAGELFVDCLAACPTSNLSVKAAPPTSCHGFSTLRPVRHLVDIPFAPSSAPTAPESRLFGLSLIDLLARHLRALLGGNFYQPPTPTELQLAAWEQPSLLDVVLTICAQAISSIFPIVGPKYKRSEPTKLRVTRGTVLAEDMICLAATPGEIRANKCLQIVAAEVLEEIIKILIHSRSRQLGSLATSLVFRAKLSQSLSITWQQVYSYWASFITNESSNPSAGMDFSYPSRYGGMLTTLGSNATASTFGNSGEERCHEDFNALFQAYSSCLPLSLLSGSLLSTVLHCLACSLELVYWPTTLDFGHDEMIELQNQEARNLPTCLRLLLNTEASPGLPVEFRDTQFLLLLRLTSTILELCPFFPTLVPTTTAQVARSPSFGSQSLAQQQHQQPSDATPSCWPWFRLTIHDDSAPGQIRLLPAHPAHLSRTTSSTCIQSSCSSDTNSPTQLIYRLPGYLRQNSHMLDLLMCSGSGLTQHQGIGCQSLLMASLALGLYIPSKIVSSEETPSKAIRRPESHCSSMSPRLRLDLHPAWFDFVLSSCAFWDSARPRLVAICVHQICTSLSILAKHALAPEAERLPR